MCVIFKFYGYKDRKKLTGKGYFQLNLSKAC